MLRLRVKMTRTQARLISRNWPEFGSLLDEAPCGDIVDIVPPSVRLRSGTIAHGPGTELKRLLARAGFLPGGCQCDARAALMDREGCDWCELNITTIVGWLEEEAKARAIAFPRTGLWLLVKAAIAGARRKQINLTL